MDKVDVAIIGAGIVGLATARRIKQLAPNLQVVVIEKEKELACHQTGHNSGVIHSGTYYKPGSLKAKNCVLGAKQLRTYCLEKDIPIDVCGKLIVATEQSELASLKELERRGRANQVGEINWLEGEKAIQEIEPFATGIAAVHLPDVAVVDYKKVAASYASDFIDLGGEILLNSSLSHVDVKKTEVILAAGKQELVCRHLINCGGLHSDRIANKLCGVSNTEGKIVPFRGEYYYLSADYEKKVKGLIYPVPNPQFPFLGVHITRKVDGSVEAGPNAVLAFHREGYSWSKFSVKDTWETCSYQGFWRLASKCWPTGLKEIWRSISKQAFLHSLQKLMPSLQSDDLKVGGSGVRAQILKENGALHDDFLFSEQGPVMHVLNAPSPGATASLAIADHICTEVTKKWNL